jgi:transposase
MFGCVPPMLNTWIKQHVIDSVTRDGLSIDPCERIKSLKREVKELRRANQIRKLASGFFTQAQLERQLKPHKKAPRLSSGCFFIRYFWWAVQVSNL